MDRRTEMHKKAIFFLLLIVSLSTIQEGYGQHLATDSLMRKASSDYLRLMKQQAALYNGAEYLAPKQLIEGYPFFGQEQYFDGMLVSSGVSFFNVPIQYDLVRDALLIWSYDRAILLMLNTEKIERFQLGKESFIRGSLIAHNDDQSPKGFFQVIHEGRHLAIAKKQKVVVQKTASDKSYAFYKQFNTYYLVIEGEWRQVSNKNDVLQVLKQKKEEVKRFINQRGLNYRKAPEVFLSEVLAYFETLNG